MDEEILAAAREAQRLSALSRRTFVEWEREVAATEGDPKVRRRTAQVLCRRAWQASRDASDRLRALCGYDQALYEVALNGALLEVEA